MITCRDIILKLLSLITNSSTLSSLFQQHFQTLPTINISGTGRQSESTKPNITLIFNSRSITETELLFDFTLMLAFEDNSITKDSTNYNGYSVVKYEGPEKLEILLEAIASLLPEISSSMTVNEITYNFETIELFPMIVGTIDFILSFPKILGNFQPEII